MNIERKKIAAAVGMMSLVGVRTDTPPPYSFGNYFSFATSRENFLAGKDMYCVNMWAENLNAARHQFLPDGLIEVDVVTERVFSKYSGQEHDVSWAIVVDQRIPSNWLHDAPYFCGVMAIPSETLIQLVDKYHWNKQKSEKYIDPVSYYAKQPNTSYDPETRVVCYSYPQTENK